MTKKASRTRIAVVLFAVAVLGALSVSPRAAQVQNATDQNSYDSGYQNGFQAGQNSNRQQAQQAQQEAEEASKGGCCGGGGGGA
ncbi:MAG TPA: hypothetical protein DCM05_04960 [Elusimicrobia bacterium]|nr:hypothetical protein [Elusimicrobiota bacterium]